MVPAARRRWAGAAGALCDENYVNAAAVIRTRFAPIFWLRGARDIGLLYSRWTTWRASVLRRREGARINFDSRAKIELDGRSRHDATTAVLLGVRLDMALARIKTEAGQKSTDCP